MDQPKIPTLKDSQKPQVKVRGMSAGLTLFDRLKSFRKKDLAFILAGLGTLFMAPLAEHFMMAPEGADSTLQPGLGGKGPGGGSGIFNGSGTSPYEPGTNGLAPGGAIGGGSDIITPLNVRDPSALVMGPGATQQPPTNSVAPAPPPPTAPSTRSESDLKDALAASARGVGAAAGAVKKALMPVPKIALGGSGLRGLGVSAGGSSASASLGGVTSNGLVSGKAASGGGLSHVTAAPGYKGVAARGPGSGAGKGIEGLKGAADAAGNRMNEGNAGAALNDAANTGIPNGGGSFGGNGQGGAAPNDKAGTTDNDKSSKNVGESLAFMKAKMQMEKDMELQYKEKEANDWALQGAQWRNKLIENGLVGPLGDAIGGYIKKAFGPGTDKGSWICKANDGTANSYVQADAGDVGDCSSSTYCQSGSSLYICQSNGEKTKVCNPSASQAYGATGTCSCLGCSGGSAAAAAPAAPPGPGAGAFPKMTTNVGAALGVDCGLIKGQIANMGPNGDATLKTYAQGILDEAKKVTAQRDVLTKGRTNDCESGGLYDGVVTGAKGTQKTVLAALNDAATTLSGQGKDISQVVGLLTKKDSDMTQPLQSLQNGDFKTVDNDILDAANFLKEVKGSLQASGTKLNAAIPPAVTGSFKQAVQDIQGANAALGGANGPIPTLSDVLDNGSTGLKQQKKLLDKEVGGGLVTDGNVVKIGKVNAKLDSDVTQHPIIKNGTVIPPATTAITPPPLDPAPAYAPAQGAAAPAHPGSGDVSADIGTAKDSISTAKSALNDFKNDPQNKPNPQPAVNDSGAKVSAAYNGEAAALNGIDSAIQGQITRMTPTP